MRLASQFLDRVEHGPSLSGWKRRWRDAAEDARMTRVVEILADRQTHWSDYRDLENAMLDYRDKIERSRRLIEMRDELETLLSERGRYAYQEGRSPTKPMTAEGLLCRIYLGAQVNDPGFLSGLDYLAEHPPSRRDRDIYYWYYGAQVMHHVGGERWDAWNERLREALTETQRKSGREAGSWRDLGGFSSEGGPIYVTSLAVCTLEVYYRHLPIFRQIDIE